MLQEAGYVTGKTGKGWGPGNPGMKNGMPRELIGTNMGNSQRSADCKGDFE